jgi:hypothetical protein
MVGKKRKIIEKYYYPAKIIALKKSNDFIALTPIYVNNYLTLSAVNSQLEILS